MLPLFTNDRARRRRACRRTALLSRRIFLLLSNQHGSARSFHLLVELAITMNGWARNHTEREWNDGYRLEPHQTDLHGGYWQPNRARHGDL